MQKKGPFLTVQNGKKPPKNDPFSLKSPILRQNKKISLENAVFGLFFELEFPEMPKMTPPKKKYPKYPKNN